MNYFHGSDEWDEAYKNGKWDYLNNNNSELQRQKILASYCVPINIQSKIKVLELGCGIGNLSGFIPTNSKYVGIDISKKAISIAKEKYTKRKFLLIDITSSDFKEYVTSSIKFDYIIASEIIYYLTTEELNNFIKVLSHICNMSNPTIIISMCRSDNYYLYPTEYYWSAFDEKFNPLLKSKYTDSTYTWDIKIFKGLQGN